MSKVSTVVHLLVAVVLMGHLLYRATVVASLRKSLDPPAHDLSQLLVRRTNWIGWVCIAILLVTGFLLLANWHINAAMLTTSYFYLNRFGMLFVLKFLGTIVIIIFLLPTNLTMARLRLPFLLGLAIILASVLLVR